MDLLDSEYIAPLVIFAHFHLTKAVTCKRLPYGQGVPADEVGEDS
jgi:hypothetical protein